MKVFNLWEKQLVLHWIFHFPVLSYLLSSTTFCMLRDVFCAGRVADVDLKRTMKACGGAVQTSVESLTEDVLGSCEVFEEQQIGGER